MKIKDFFKKPKDGHCVCDVHNQADEVIDDAEATKCPWCKSKIEFQYLYAEFCQTSSIAIVGETNCCDPEEEVTKAIVFDCPDCGKKISLDFKPIIWNANHDVFYTGGKKYIYDSDKIQRRFKQLAEPLIADYTKRILAGEKNLKPINLCWWLECVAEQVVAEYLNK